MKTSSAKAKGRNLQNSVREMIMTLLPEELKCQTRTALMGESGVDVKLVSTARSLFPWAVECKNQERPSVWAAWEQTVKNADKEKLKPLLSLKKNHKEILIVLRATDFFDLLRDKK